MALGRAFSRLSLRKQHICCQCRRSLATSTKPRQKSATESLTERLQSNPNSASSSSQTSSGATKPSSPSLLSLAFAQESLRNNAAKQLSRERLEENRKAGPRADLEQNSFRRWAAGDVYAPHDLSAVEQSKWQKPQQRTRVGKSDVMDQLGINPLDHYKNISMMSEYVTRMGRIKHSKDTKLRPVNQRRMARAIRRAIGIGLIPGVHRHPEILKRQHLMGQALRGS